MSSVERIASKLSMHNRYNSKMPRIDSNPYHDHNMSMDPNDLSILSIGHKNKIHSNKASSMSNSPRRSSKGAPTHIYNLHQMEYDYSIITKDSQRLLNHKRPIKLSNNKIELNNHRILKNKSILPKLRQIGKHK